MDGNASPGNLILLEPLLRSRRAARRGSGRWLVLGAALAIALLASLAPPADPQPLTLDEDGRPSMLIE